MQITNPTISGTAVDDSIESRSVKLFMSTDKIAEIVRRAMADRTVYDAMIAAEKKVWGKTLPDRERSKAAAEDTKAGAALGICRYNASLFRVAKEKRLMFIMASRSDAERGDVNAS